MSTVIKTSENGSIHIYESTEDGKGHTHIYHDGERYYGHGEDERPWRD